jgi:phosphatidate cytidylyltransferase
VAGEKRDGDELFEDLDKFFAPIRDVDWDEPEQPAAADPQTPQEEHVEVRTGDPAVRVTAEPEDGGSDAPTSSWDPEADAEDDGGVVHDDPTEGVEDILIVSEEVEEAPEVASAQAGFFDDGDEDDEDGWLAGGEDVAEPTVTIETEGWVEVGEPVVAAPSDEDLEAAAEHFAGSIRSEETYATEPVDVFGDAEIDDDGGLLDDLGAADEVEEDILADLHEPAEAPRTVVVGTEGISGPSWQDVAAVEVGADVERRGPNLGERDMPAAFLTGLFLAGIAVGALVIGDAAFAIVAGIVVLVAQGELFGVMVKRHAQPATAVGLVAGALMMAAAYLHGEAATPAMFALGVIATFCWYMTVPAAHRKDVVRNIGLTVLNMAWIPLLAGYLIATLKLEDGRALVVAIFGLTFVFDAAAFLVGSVWGGSAFQRALAPTVSPKKSIEGLIGATIVTLVVAVALVPAFIEVFEDQKIDALLLGLVVALAATLGDLAESLIKRDLGVKDMGSVLPGHGGVLDRIDSLLFVAPAAYLLLRVIGA